MPPRLVLCVVLQMLAFNAPEEFFREPGDEVVAWFQPTINEWQGARTVEGRLKGGCYILSMSRSNKITTLTNHRQSNHHQCFRAAVVVFVVYCYA